jgi:hypothetical protein
MIDLDECILPDFQFAGLVLVWPQCNAEKATLDWSVQR